MGHALFHIVIFSMLMPAAVITLFIGFRPGYHWRLALLMLT
jgi:hypothetical protein